MQSNKPIQKKPKDHNTSPQRTKKDKAQTQDQSRFQLVPLPQKFVNLSKIHRLYADLIIMESDDTIISDGSLYNIYKIYQRIEIENHTSQRLVRVYLQNKDNQLEDWRKIVDKIRNSVSSNVRPWAELVKTYCERYEEMIQEFQGEMPSEKKTQLSEINVHTKKIRQTLINTHPLIEFTSQLRNGHIELTEIAYSEKYLAELGYGVDEMVNAVFKGGIPIFFPLNSRSSWPARMGLEKWMTVEPDGTRTPEIDIYILTKDGTVKTAKCILHYHIIYEKGALGFLCFITVMGKPKACTESVKPMEKLIMTKDFTNMSFEKEMEHADFLEMFYGIRPEHR